MKTPDKMELEQTASNHLSDIKFKNFVILYKNYTKEPYSILVSNTTVPSDNSLRFRKNLL